MAFIFSFSDDRIDQLGREDKINDQLLEKCNECPEILANYFYLQRKKNKQQTEKIANAGFFDKYNVIKKNMEEYDNQLTHMEHELSDDTNCPCNWLKMVGKYNV